MTTTIPTTSGWYWALMCGSLNPRPVQLILDSHEDPYVINGGESYDLTAVEIWGPRINEPEGLRRAPGGGP